MSNQLKIEVRLRADRLCYLSRETRFSLVLFLKLTSGQPVTVVRHDDKHEFGLVNLITSQLIECFDTESGQRISVLRNAEEHSRLKNPEAANLSLMVLGANRSEYLSFTSDSHPRDYEFVFTPDGLQANRNYTIKCNPATLKWWSPDSEDSVYQYLATYGDLSPPGTPPIQCVPISTVSFDTRQDLPQPPKIDVSLAAPPTLSLSGIPPFQFSVTFISHASKPITVLAERHHVQVFESDLEIIDETTNRRVAPDLIDANIDGLWLPEDFLCLGSEVPYVEQRLFDPTRSYDGLQNFRVGTDYILRILPGHWSWWSFDSVEEVMQYAGERGGGRLGYQPAIELVCQNEVKFCVVE